VTSLLDHPLITERYFFPRRVRLPAPTLVEVDGATLACTRIVKRADFPTLVHFHGNGEVVAEYLCGDFLDHLSTLDLNLFFAEYRGYGASTGTPGLARMLSDVDAIFTVVNVPAARMVVYGRSVGSIYALELAHRHPDVGALILESGIAAPIERIRLRVTAAELGATDAQLAAECDQLLNHERKLAGFPGPLLTLHTRWDQTVGCDNSERLARWARGPCTSVFFDTGDHNSILDDHGAAIARAVGALVNSLR
jgi:pimeloyl-ACP methyl ester carboxylesterase